MFKVTKYNTLRPFDWFLILGVILANIIYSILESDFDLVGSVAAVTGVICVVLVAKGNIINYFFGLINVSLYAWISFKAGLFGDAALNAFYYLPMQFIGWYGWVNKRESDNSVTVVALRMSQVQRLYLSLFTLFAVAVVALILKYFGDPQPVKDSATTVLSIIAMFLMVKRYTEQWVLWIAVNIISVVMWSIAFTRGESHSVLMVIMWIFYLMNSVNGLINWMTLSRNSLKESRLHANR